MMATNKYRQSIFCGLVLLSLYLNVGYAQQSDYNTKNAFIVTNGNDTIRGLIKDLSDFRNRFLFRERDASSYRTYTPDEVKLFRLEDGSYYKSVQFESPTSEKHFLRCLVDGQLSLYKEKDYYYFAKRGGDPVKVVSRDTIVDGYSSKGKRHIGVLRFMTSDCPGIQGTMDKVKFFDEDLISGVIAYNECVTPSKKIEIARPAKVKTSIGLRTSLLFSTVKYADSQSIHHNETYDAGVGFLGGVWINFRHRDKFSFQPELTLVQKNSSFRSGRNSSRISETYLQIPFSFYYHFPVKRKVQPFASFGVLVGFGISSNSYREIYDSFNQRPYRIDTDAGEGEFGWRAGAGILLSKHWRLEYAWEKVRMDARALQNDKIVCFTQSISFNYVLNSSKSH
jgi:hypothetical protein